MGNAAMSMLADKLGVPNNKAAVEKAIQQASPEQLAELCCEKLIKVGD